MTTLTEQIVTAVLEAGLNWHAQDREDFTDPGKAERAVAPLIDPLLEKLAALEAENASLRAQMPEPRKPYEHHPGYRSTRSGPAPYFTETAK